MPHISREVFDMISTDQQAIQYSMETTYFMTDGVKSHQKGISSFVGLDNTLSFLSLRDTGSTKPPHFSRDSVAIITRNGKITITPEKYMEIVSTFKPDLFHTLCDGETNEQSGNKRNFNAVYRSKAFFQQCADRYKASASLSDSLLLGKISFFLF